MDKYIDNSKPVPAKRRRNERLAVSMALPYISLPSVRENRDTAHRWFQSLKRVNEGQIATEMRNSIPDGSQNLTLKILQALKESRRSN